MSAAGMGQAEEGARAGKRNQSGCPEELREQGAFARLFGFYIPDGFFHCLNPVLGSGVD